MKSALVLNTLLKSDRWLQKIGNLEPVVELLKKFGQIWGKDDTFLVVNEGVMKKIGDNFKGYEKIEIPDGNAKDLFQGMYRTLSSYDIFTYGFIDTPLIDMDITKKMLLLHEEEFAEYTYGEGFPPGVVPEVVNVNLLPKVVALLERDTAEILRDSLFYVLSKDINSFDIETYFAPVDLKLKRIELSTSLKRNALLTERIIEREGISCSYEHLCKLLDESPLLMRTVPSFVEVEITTSVNGASIYSPVPLLKRNPGSMSFENYRLILDKILDFSEDVYIAFSFLGEPLQHQDIERFIEYSISNKRINLILETDGVFFKPHFSDYINDLKADNLHVIFDLDAVSDETYGKIREGNINQVERNIRYLLSKTRQNIYVQMVRMDINEEEMLKFYDIWEKEGAKVIIQKYNSYLELLPPLSQSDLRPLERMSCFHLLRDFVVFHNGDVPRCKQDINGIFNLGNLIREEISSVWERGGEFYLQHCKQNYDEYCTVCDEYFTFNF